MEPIGLVKRLFGLAFVMTVATRGLSQTTHEAEHSQRPTNVRFSTKLDAYPGLATVSGIRSVRAVYSGVAHIMPAGSTRKELPFSVSAHLTPSRPHATVDVVNSRTLRASVSFELESRAVTATAHCWLQGQSATDYKRTPLQSHPDPHRPPWPSPRPVWGEAASRHRGPSSPHVASSAPGVPDVILVAADGKGGVTVESIRSSRVELPANTRGLVVWSEGKREYWQVISDQWMRPHRSTAQQFRVQLGTVSRGLAGHSATGSDMTQLTTQLAQLTVSGVLRAVGRMVTPYDGAEVLSARVTFRREAAEGDNRLPAAKATLLTGGQELLQFEFPEKVARLRWTDIPNRPEAIRDGLSAGAYELRHEGAMGLEVVRFRVHGQEQWNTVMRHAEALGELLQEPGHPLPVQVAVDQLLAHQPAFLADALDMLDEIVPDKLTPHLAQLRQHVAERLKDPGQAVLPPEAPGESTGDPVIDEVRSLIFAGRWDDATEVLDAVGADSPAESIAMADLYRAVILAESGLGKEEKAAELFRRAIELLERLAKRSSSQDKTEPAVSVDANLYRAHNNFANFLLGQARDRLHNHAFQMAAGVERPLLTALVYWIEARQHYDRALELAASPEQRSAVRINLARLHFLLADVVRTFEHPDAPLQGLSEVERGASSAAMSLLTKVSEESAEEPSLMSVAEELLGSLHFRAGDFAKAAKHGETAREGYLQMGSLTGVESAHRLLGLCCRAAGEGDRTNEALQHFLISQQLAEVLRERYPADEFGLSRAGFFARRAYVTEQIVELLIGQGNHAEALLFAEAGKARALQDLLATSGIPDSQAATAHEQVRTLLADWPKGYAALEYFLAGERAWLFVVAPDGKVSSFLLTDPSGEPIASRDLLAQAQSFLGGIDRLGPAVGRRLANQVAARRPVNYPQPWQDELHALYNILVPVQARESLQAAHTVVVVPQHVLHYFPFAALVTEPDTKAAETRMPLPRFFVEEPFALNHAPSLATWHQLRQREHRPLEQAQVMGIVDFGHRAGRLSGVANELKAIHSVFGDRVRTSLTEGEVTKTNARRLLGQPGITVLATHGQKQPDRPLEGYLIVHPDGQSDGYLTAAEIYETQVDSDLIMLTACYGGFADRSPMPGDDLFGLQRALLRSGGRTVFSGLWDVYDGTAPDLVESFCTHLAGGAPAPLALAEAQRTFLRKWRQESPDARKVLQFLTHPYYWAVFTITGDDRTGGMGKSRPASEAATEEPAAAPPATAVAPATPAQGPVSPTPAEDAPAAKRAEPPASDEPSDVAPDESPNNAAEFRPTDQAFDRYVDLALAWRAIEELDAALLTDVAMQLSEGERVLGRQHSQVASNQLFRLAARMAVMTGNSQALERLQRFAKRQPNAIPTEILAAYPARSGAMFQEFKVDASRTTPEAFAALGDLLRAVRVASLVGDRPALDAIEKNLALVSDVDMSQLESLREIVAEARGAIPEDGESSAALVALMAGSRPAWDHIPGRTATVVKLDVLVAGRPLPTVSHQGKTYLPVPGHGVEYTIRVRNLGQKRIVAVVGVDGLSVMDGRPFSENGSGYVVNPGGECLIPGWRRGDEKVAAFSFQPRDASYAAQTGRPSQIGTIRLVAIEEYIPAPVAPARPSLPGRWGQPIGATPPAGSTGTGYGREVEHRVVSVQFRRSAIKHAMTFIYNTREALAAAGVPVSQQVHPASHFTPPPPGWREEPKKE